MSDALFEPDRDLFVPTQLARGPWAPDAQHGGAPSALLARCIERFENSEGGMFVARLTIELLRPVPLTPLRVSTSFARPGKKVQLVAASLHAGDVEVVRALGLRIRNAELPVPPDTHPVLPAPLRPDAGRQSMAPWHRDQDYVAYHSHAVEHRFVRGSFVEPGPATDWIRLRVPVIAGEQILPISRVAAAADFGNGISWVLPRSEGFVFINPDLTIYLHRLPAGEWVCLDSVTHPQGHGVGLAESRLWDEEGPIGHALQSLFLDRSDAARLG